MGTPPSELELEHRASTAYDNGAYIRAIFLLKQALKLDPDNPKLLTNLGSAENEASNYTSALRSTNLLAGERLYCIYAT
jgi:tetratricopeptide (TPR) repeat protein